MAGKRLEYLTWDEYFMGVAILSSQRSKDPSTQTGACIINDDKKIVSVGYNGATIGMNDEEFPWDSLGEKTNDLVTTKNPWVVHAELNAILNSPAPLKDTTIYVTFFPCNECAKAIAQAGIKKVVYLRMFTNPEIVEISKRIFEAANIEYIAYNEEKEFTKSEVQESSVEIQKILKRFS